MQTFRGVWGAEPPHESEGLVGAKPPHNYYDGCISSRNGRPAPTKLDSSLSSLIARWPDHQDSQVPVRLYLEYS